MLSGAAAIVNYDPKQPTLKSLAPWANPSLMRVFFSFEFWFYTTIHLGIVFLTITDVLPLLDVDWKAAGAFQYFTTFFLTFYNGNCYARYQKLYLACTELMDATLLFVREMTICFKDQTTWKHRLQATKWLLAAVHLFFLGVCGDRLSMKGWSEVVKKGLLTKMEAQMLIKYPGPEIVPILTTWTMICVADGLERPCFHEKKKAEWPTCRTQKIAHLHNRLDRILVKLMGAYREISETMAQPIPFAYWHLMNLVFTLNFMLLALILASFKHWMTIVPYAMALMTFMGLREVSNQLADPFGDDIIDFPLAKYLDYTFDHSVCLLTAFSSADAYERVRKQVGVSPLFDDRQIKRHTSPEQMYNENYVPHVDGVFIWEKEQPLQEANQLYANESLQDHIKKSLAGIPIGDYGAANQYVESEDEFIVPVSVKDNHDKWLAQAIEDVDILSSFPASGFRSTPHRQGQAPYESAGSLGVESVCRAMFSPSKDSVSRACSALHAMLQQNGDNQFAFECCKGLEAVSVAMDKYIDNVQVMRQACGVIESFAEGDEARWKVLQGYGITPRIVATMAKHPDSSALQEACVRVLKCVVPTSLAGQYLIKINGLESVMTAMDAHQRNPTLQEHCITFLADMSDCCLQGRKKILESPVLPELLRLAMFASPGNEKLQMDARRIIKRMPTNEEDFPLAPGGQAEDNDLEASRPLDRPDRSNRIRDKAFQWGFQNHGRHDHTPGTRSFRADDVTFELGEDGSGRLQRISNGATDGYGNRSLQRSQTRVVGDVQVSGIEVTKKKTRGFYR